MARMTELSNALKAHDDYVVIGHINPDGDAAGSCIALAEALIALGKRACVFLPGGVAQMYRAFACTVTVAATAEELPFAPQTAFCVDISNPERMGAGEAVYAACAHHLMLDHHATNVGFGETYFVDGQAAACGELALELIGELGVSLNSEMATWLYIAIVTDCGQFGFSSTRAATHMAAAACLKADIDVDFITRELYRTRSLGRTRLMGLVLAGLEIDAGGEIAWARLTKDMLSRAGALREDNEGIVNYLLEIRDVRFAVLAEEMDATTTKFSLRSKAPLDAAAVAVPLGGGGHARAAGLTLNEPLEQALSTVLKCARAAIASAEDTRA